MQNYSTFNTDFGTNVLVFVCVCVSRVLIIIKDYIN